MHTADHPNVPQIMLPGQAAAAPGPLDMANMYLAHYGFRRDLGHLLTAIGRIRLDDRRRVSALREHHAWVLFVLHHHHTAEDEKIWPRLRERAPGAIGTIDALEAEHEACDHWIRESTEAFQAFDSGPSEQGRERLTTALRTLADTLGAHLAHEETDGIPLMMAHITPEEDAEMHKTIMKDYGLYKLVKLVGWTSAEVPADVEAHLRATAPRQLLMISNLAGRRYRRRTAYLWG
ncbi:hemerythrin domain-containing protein [Nonomuraea sediminis]|uniref:hemerythrin domain-containing protein n=1 Tax=Nonomuraea sediminis TaxID=2835864 RepID=UPI001BDCE8A8|nr:hemerythrin domain-containing protein [Nonomuraea sediminis]